MPPLPESVLQRALKPPREYFSGMLGLFPGVEETGYTFLLSDDRVDRKPFPIEIHLRGSKGGDERDRI